MAEAQASQLKNLEEPVESEDEEETEDDEKIDDPKPEPLSNYADVSSPGRTS